MPSAFVIRAQKPFSSGYRCWWGLKEAAVKEQGHIKEEKGFYTCHQFINAPVITHAKQVELFLLPTTSCFICHVVPSELSSGLSWMKNWGLGMNIQVDVSRVLHHSGKSLSCWSTSLPVGDMEEMNPVSDQPAPSHFTFVAIFVYKSSHF